MSFYFTTTIIEFIYTFNVNVGFKRANDYEVIPHPKLHVYSSQLLTLPIFVTLLTMTLPASQKCYAFWQAVYDCSCSSYKQTIYSNLKISIFIPGINILIFNLLYKPMNLQLVNIFLKISGSLRWKEWIVSTKHIIDKRASVNGTFIDRNLFTLIPSQHTIKHKHNTTRIHKIAPVHHTRDTISKLYILHWAILKTWHYLYEFSCLTLHY